MEPHSLSADELRQVLHELHADEYGGEIKPDGVQVRDICELTGVDEARIIEIIQHVRHEDREARLVQALAEMEAPLYSVERPTTNASPDPVFGLPWKRTETAQSLLRDLEQRESKRRLKRKPNLEPTATDKLVGNVILFAFTAAFVVLMLVVIVRFAILGAR